MNILFIGDPHLQFSKFDISKRFLLWLDEVIEQYKPNMVVNLGDTFHDHGILRSEILCEFNAHVRRVIDKTPYVYILGNHDMHKPNDATYHALQPFKGVYDKFQVIDSVMHNKKLGISFVPYQWDTSLFPQETQRICIAHQTFLGADFGDYRPDSGVSLEDVSAEIIISGHIHKRQTVNSKLIYPGTPFAQNAKDVNQDKGLMLFNTDTYETIFIPSPFPRWQRVSFNLENQSIDEIIGFMFLFTSKDNWVIDVLGPKNEVIALLENKRFKEVQKHIKIKVNTSYTDKQKLSNISIKKTSVKDIANEYIDKVYSGQISKTLLKQALEEIL